MTLTTQIRIYAPELSPEVLFGFMREAIGIPQDRPADISPLANGWTSIRSLPGGFDSALRLCASVNGQPGEPEGEGLGLPPCTHVVTLDTAYGFKGRSAAMAAHVPPRSSGCSGLHYELTARLGAWLDGQRGTDWWVEDEFEGDWHHRHPAPLTDAERQLVEDGAQDWLVVPWGS